MPITINNSGTLKTLTNVYTNNAGAITEANTVSQNNSGTLKVIHTGTPGFRLRYIDVTGNMSKPTSTVSYSETYYGTVGMNINIQLTTKPVGTGQMESHTVATESDIIISKDCYLTYQISTGDTITINGVTENGTGASKKIKVVAGVKISFSISCSQSYGSTNPKTTASAILKLTSS